MAARVPYVEREELDAEGQEIYDRIRRGDVYYHTVIIPEGFNLFDIGQALEDAQLVSRDAFLTAAKQQMILIADLDPQAPSLEGYLFPDTYRFQRLETPARILAAMVSRVSSLGCSREVSSPSFSSTTATSGWMWSPGWVPAERATTRPPA